MSNTTPPTAARAISPAAIIQTSAFLTKLPAEVRVKIYREVFRGLAVEWKRYRNSEPFKRRFDGNLYRLYLGRTKQSLALIMTSSQTRLEAMPILHDMIIHEVGRKDLLLIPEFHILFGCDNIRHLLAISERDNDLNINALLRVFPQLKSIELITEKCVRVDTERAGDSVSFREFSKEPSIRAKIFSAVANVLLKRQLATDTEVAVLLQCGLTLESNKSPHDHALVSLPHKILDEG